MDSTCFTNEKLLCVYIFIRNHAYSVGLHVIQEYFYGQIFKNVFQNGPRFLNEIVGLSGTGTRTKCDSEVDGLSQNLVLGRR